MAELRKAAGAAVRFAKPRGIRSLALLLPIATDFPAINTARAAIEGAIIADYDSDTYRTDRKDRSIEQRHAARAGRRRGIRIQIRPRTKASSSRNRRTSLARSSTSPATF